ncbi:hypothetical protein [Variovorax paradoxus]|uniref:hypothetical protein n=1 Tax=Variovorax paradoxus TaxID=34073 RepID=UPI0012BC8F5F|nr:hypothetical protein [Variovorax paradoxus]
MPYSMIVFVPPVSEDDEAAVGMILDYDDDPRNEGLPLDRRLHALIDELAQIYPRSASLPPERCDECIWAEEPLELNGRGRLCHFALSGRHDIDPLIERISEVALRRGLVVFDQDRLRRPSKAGLGTDTDPGILH